jgi:phage-related minor tail protein
LLVQIQLSLEIGDAAELFAQFAQSLLAGFIRGQMSREGLIEGGGIKQAAEGFDQVADWTESYRKHWEDSFDRLGEYLAEIQVKQKTQKHHGK